MILNVTYEMKDKTVKKIFKHKFINELFESARNCDLYRKSHTITYELEEVDEYGNKCGEC